MNNKDKFNLLLGSGLTFTQSLEYCTLKESIIIDMVKLESEIKELNNEIAEKIFNKFNLKEVNDLRKVKYQLLKEYGFTSQESAKFRNHTFDKIIKLIYRRLYNGC